MQGGKGGVNGEKRDRWEENIMPGDGLFMRDRACLVCSVSSMRWFGLRQLLILSPHDPSFLRS